MDDDFFTTLSRCTRETISSIEGWIKNVLRVIEYVLYISGTLLNKAAKYIMQKMRKHCMILKNETIGFVVVPLPAAASRAFFGLGTL